MEITCPYCEHSYDLCHDDGAFYNQDGREQEECPECGKYFMVSSSVSWYFEAEEADCLNGGEHKWKQSGGYPPAAFIGIFQCSVCDTLEHRDEEGRAKALKEYSDKLKS